MTPGTFQEVIGALNQIIRSNLVPGLLHLRSFSLYQGVAALGTGTGSRGHYCSCTL